MNIYPEGLPAPVRWDANARERRARSSIPGRPEARQRSAYRLLDVSAEWVYSAEQMAVWRPWFQETLSFGLQWFTASLPGYGGWLDRPARYRPNTLKLEHIASGIYRVSIDLEVRQARIVPPPIPPEVDPYFAYVVLLVHGNFDDEDSTTALIDSSSYADHKTLAAGMEISALDSLFGGSSLRIADRGAVGAYWSGPRFVRPSGTPFTIETRFKPITKVASTETPLLFRLDNNVGANVAMVSQYSTGGVIELRDDNTAFQDFAYTADSAGWVSVAMTGDESNVSRWFLQGTQVYAGAASTSVTSGGFFMGGHAGSTFQSILCYMAELRVTIGVARYLSNYTPAVTPFPNSA